ncbi:GNAT family N-acetyltransferase [Qipengyuania spongiae]|uniref:GNAT family N-acetyltransferase n=1 Tax=Qipengyuania spongiae TaxID=2909673 RepID=A0ABY5T0A6_9SPHN|nr:GNAT family N-acetyltransferase [Qipengyuania spongiae]UVI38793.1 GNAT family N-acetyltransferase [Qipengyuania spongiae]
MTCRIRRFETADAEALAELARAAILKIGARAYSPAQVAAWCSGQMTAERFRERAAAGEMILVAVGEAERPVAYTLLEPDGHLDQLYCHPDHTRRGLADRLLADAELLAIERTCPPCVHAGGLYHASSTQLCHRARQQNRADPQLRDGENHQMNSILSTR